MKQFHEEQATRPRPAEQSMLKPSLQKRAVVEQRSATPQLKWEFLGKESRLLEKVLRRADHDVFILVMETKPVAYAGMKDPLWPFFRVLTPFNPKALMRTLSGWLIGQ